MKEGHPYFGRYSAFLLGRNLQKMDVLFFFGRIAMERKTKTEGDTPDIFAVLYKKMEKSGRISQF